MKPVASSFRRRQRVKDDIFGYMTGKAKIVGDVMNTVRAEDWKAQASPKSKARVAARVEDIKRVRADEGGE